MTISIEAITILANNVYKKKYPLAGDHHFNNFEVSVILYSYLELVKSSHKYIKDNQRDEE